MFESASKNYPFGLNVLPYVGEVSVKKQHGFQSIISLYATGTIP
jgi:hypothetical protein